MLKNKEDDFHGDKFTSNVKYADNEWQAHGTVDRGSTYTKESILHLLFEGFNYDRNLGDYKHYVPRASTGPGGWLHRGKNNPYVPAKLEHDIYLVENTYYNISSSQSVKNIFDLTTFLSKGISIANPVYDSLANYKTIKVIDDSNLNETITIREVIDILSGVCIGCELATTDNQEAFINRYVRGSMDLDKTLISFDVLKDPAVPKHLDLFTGGEDRPLEIKDVFDLTLKQFLEIIGNKDNKEVEKVFEKLQKTPKDLFLEDFELRVHHRDTIKMPFSRRGIEKKGNTLLDEYSDTRTYCTRFIANSITKELTYTDTTAINYLESISDLLEEALFAVDSPESLNLYEGRSAALVPPSLHTDKELADAVLKADGQYSHVYQKKYETGKILENFVKVVDDIRSKITLYLPDIYSDYNATLNDPIFSWGIHFLNAEKTENLFQDTDKSYKLYNNVLIGYKLADALITARTFLGGVNHILFSKNTVSNSILPINISLNRLYEPVIREFNPKMKTKSRDVPLGVYASISIINNLYKKTRKKADTILTIDESTNLAEVSTLMNYNFAVEIKDWLETECFLFKGQVYGDYVEELNFLQDLTPDSNVQFKNIRVKKTDVPYKRYQDSKTEIPYVEQTAPLVNQTSNKKGLGVYGSDALAGVGNVKGNELKELGKTDTTQNVLPPFIYDYDKGDQENQMASEIDLRQQSIYKDKQRVNNESGGLVIEDRIISPTIDELWIYLKYLTESDGQLETDDILTGINEKLPTFFGVKKDFIKDTLFDKGVKAPSIRVNPLAQNIQDEAVVDILKWTPNATIENRLHWGSKNKPELQFGGYTVSRYIEKIYDYKVYPFSRRKNLNDNDTYEFNSENSKEYNQVTGYLEKLYNSITLSFDLVDTDHESPDVVDPELLQASILENPQILVGTEQKSLFSLEHDKKLTTENKPAYATIERQKAFKDLARILNYHNADGKGENSDPKSSLHNHYKEYLKNPKNLKEIERDLETIRQNLQTLVEFSVSTFVNMGYADRTKNRGTLHQLHKNAYSFVSTWLIAVNNTKANTSNTTYNYDVLLDKLTDSLNYIEESLKVVDLDRKVVFDDGIYEDRYLVENYDHFVIDLNSNPIENTRARHPMYRVNETLMSETYLAADGTWRSVHEHTVLPVLFSEH